MKKLLIILLSCVMALSLFGCANNSSLQEPKQEENSKVQWMREEYDTFIQDENGRHRCFWEDGKLLFDDFEYYDFDESYTPIQAQKSATLTLQTEYDMWFGIPFDNDFGILCLDFTKDFWPLEYKCDRTKIEIKENPEKENHFILKILQPCDNEEIAFTLTEPSMFEILTGKRIEPADPMDIRRFSITVSTPITILD